MSPQENPAQLWLEIPSDIQNRLLRCLDEAAAELPRGDSQVVFFRADDVAVPSRTFTKLVSLFLGYQVPLTLSVVPAWLTKPRWQRILEVCGKDYHLWCWTQHGWRHFNHEAWAKKMEFGPSRPFAQKRKDLWLGCQRLRELMGEVFIPAFIPPWNRCDRETLTAIQELGYRALSRSVAAQPPALATVPEYPVSVDLHTRKEEVAHKGWQNLFKELKESLASGFCGIMIHHQRMNDTAFDFLDLLLHLLKQRHHTRLVHLGTLIKENFRTENL